MLEQLNGIRWDELKHNYGAADDIPGLLRQIIDGPAADEALFKLENNLFHQGGWICSAAPAAVPFLVELAAAPGVPLRSKLVALVGNVAYEAGELRGRGVDPAWQEAWAASIPPLLELLDDADVHVRRMTTWALGAARPQAETVVERLRARWPAEPDLTVRLGLVLAAGKLSPHGATWLQGLREHPEPQVRLAATMALSRLAADIDLVCGAVRDGDLAAWRHNPWYGGTPESLVWGIDHELGGHCRARIRFATRMLAHRDPQVRIGGVKAGGRRPEHLAVRAARTAPSAGRAPR
ncbi:HEAT repeat domain-containing protein [Microtetraspora glauca]|uniref:HEAT repeat domain-containing protein n=1 Tax=Microtetraspora glauca TaxID=1996 RepID=A0ABV3GG76_MICGL